ncbi:sodium/proline symporter PutP [Corynebacterium otitidis]
MSETTWFLIAMVIYLALMVAIGLWSFRKTTNYDDYVLADRGLHPFAAALSAGASDMSGWLLLGLPGLVFMSGLSELWQPIGLLIGSFVSWTIVAPRLRAYSEVSGDSVTLPSFFESRVRDSSRALRILAAIIIIVFFGIYVASGMVSGGRYYEATFGGALDIGGLDDFHIGLIIVGVITVAYTFFGGFLAVSYTDVVQGSIMFVALLIVPIMALLALDNPSDIFSFPTENDWAATVEQEGIGNPDYFNLIPEVSVLSILYILGQLGWGVGYFGQPHIVVRYMALKKPSQAIEARNYGFGWMLLCVLGAVSTAVIGVTFFTQNPDIQVTDQENFESVFLDMGRILFHPLIAGLVLTAVLAAIMSTMSSQLLVVSSSLIEDLYRIIAKTTPSQRFLVTTSRTAVIVVSVLAAIFAWNPQDSILDLVGFAWAGFGSAFGPLMLFALYWKRLNAPGAISGMVVGAVVSFVWGSIDVLTDHVYEILPGFLSSVIVTYVVTILTSKPSQEIVDEFEHTEKLVKASKKNKEASFEEIRESIES